MITTQFTESVTARMARAIRDQAGLKGKTYDDVRAAFTEMTDDEFAAVWNGEGTLYVEPAYRFAVTIGGEEHWTDVIGAIFDRAASA